MCAGVRACLRAGGRACGRVSVCVCVRVRVCAYVFVFVRVMWLVCHDDRVSVRFLRLEVSSCHAHSSFLSCCLSPPPQDGTTPLIMAAQNGRFKAVRLLLGHNANVEAKMNVRPRMHADARASHSCQSSQQSWRIWLFVGLGMWGIQ